MSEYLLSVIRLMLNRWFALLMVLYVGVSTADDEVLLDKMTGLEVATAADRLNSDFKDMTVDLEMILVNKKGRESKRQLSIKVLEGELVGDKTLTRFSAPRDIRGTGLLSYSHKNELSDQWLFLPGLKRVKRIAAKNKSRPFVGSEFTYEDMTKEEIDRYQYNLLREEACGRLQCYVLERKPLDKYSGYSKQVVWLDTEAYRIQKIALFNKRNKHAKTLTYSGYQQYQNRYWRPDLMVMQNHENNRSTQLHWQHYQFGLGLKDTDFSQLALKKIR